ncbi:MAG: DNA repair protein RadA, partial [Chitinophagia bacterium]|nr:DNA repair protein RadA [Chitinophagia bacterium]
MSIAGTAVSGNILESQTLNQSVKSDNKRLVSGIKEVDDVLGGGIVAGSINLIAGQPGIGKSTLLLQLANKIASQVPTLYISGEE